MKNNYYPLLDGLRGLAVLLVVIRHCVHSDVYIVDFIRMKCWIGVDVFFALSGFLITDILLRDKGSTKFFRRFYIRRILRIFPLYYASLLIFILITWYFGITKNYILIENIIYFFTYAQNFYLAFTEESPGNLILFHFWSLAVEEHFYLFWPLVIHFFQGYYVFLVCVVLIVTCTVLRYYFPSNVNYISTFTRLDSLAAGSALAWLYSSGRFSFKYLPMLTLVSFVLLMVIMIAKPMHLLPFKFTLVAIFSACLVAHCVIENNFKNIMNSVLNNGIMKSLGKYSYGIYVLHFPVYVYFYILIKEQNFLSGIGFVFVLGFIVFVSYKCLEHPFLKLKNKWAPYN